MLDLDHVFDPDRASGFTVPVSVSEHLARSKADSAHGTDRTGVTASDERLWYIELAEHLAAVTAGPQIAAGCGWKARSENYRRAI